MSEFDWELLSNGVVIAGFVNEQDADDIRDDMEDRYPDVAFSVEDVS